MKLALIFLCVLAAATATPITDEEAHTHVHHAGSFSAIRKSGSSLATAERKFGRGDSQAAVMCAARCSQTYKESVERELPNYDQNAAATAKVIDVETFNKLCPIHDTVQTCINACPSSQAKTILSQVFGLTQFICHDSVIRAKAPCINEAVRSSQATCSSQCGAYERAFNNYQRSPPANLEVLADMLKQTCLLTSCNINCPKEAVIRNCGQQAQNDINTLGKKAATFLKTTMEVVGAGAIYPNAECDAVGA